MPHLGLIVGAISLLVKHMSFVGEDRIILSLPAKDMCGFFHVAIVKAETIMVSAFAIATWKKLDAIGKDVLTSNEQFICSLQKVA